MGGIAAYSINVALLLIAMYLIYRWLLASEKMFAFNRAVILCIYGLSLAFFPVVGLIYPSDVVEPAHAAVAQPLSIDQLMMLNDLNNAGVEASTPVGGVADTPLWAKVTVIVYFVGVILLLTRSLILWFKLFRLINSGVKHRCGKYTLVLIDKRAIAPFSWMRYIVMSVDDFQAAREMIISHETRHLDCRHWIDMLVAEVVTIFNWFNPAAWLLKEELKTVHEYQADMAVINSGINPKEYQLLLIKKAVGARFPSFANSLNHSKLKKRITMMLSSQSSKRRRLRALALAPALAVAVLILNQSAVASVLTEISSSRLSSGVPETDGKDNQKISIQGNSVAIVGDSVATEIQGAEDVDVTYFLNGEPATKQQIDALDPASIANMNINRNNSVATVHVTTKGTESSISTATTPAGTAQSSTVAYSYGIYTGSLDSAAYIIDKLPATAMQWVALSDEVKERSIVVVEDGKVTVIAKTEAPDSSLSEATYLVNGEEVSAEFVQSIAPSLIESMTVDKSGGNTTIIITLKDSAQ